MIAVHGQNPVTLRFYGGFFSPVPGAGAPKGMEVHFRFADSVKLDPPDEELERLLTSAVRLDFIGEGELHLPDGTWARPLSHVLPIDYHGFRKTIGFRGGSVKRLVPTALLKKRKAKLASLVSSHKRTPKAFSEFTGIEGHHSEHIRDLSREFFREVNGDGEALATWLTGYGIEVTTHLSRVLVNGIMNGGHHGPSKAHADTLPGGAVIEFRALAGSHLPHYPANNPHVMEEPPTI